MSVPENTIPQQSPHSGEPTTGVETPPNPSRTRITLRAIATGLLGVVTICLLAPYNDFTLANTPLIGNYLPIVSVFLLFIFAVSVNGPLSRFAPHLAFSHTEVAVVCAMILAGCAVPTTGLMRYFLPSLVIPQSLADSSPDFGRLLHSMHLPDWIYPSFQSSDRTQWPRDPIVTGYVGRWTDPGPVPYAAFLRPLLTWGAFFGLLATALLSLVHIAYHQWVHNERLPFPLAQIQIALLTPARPGDWFNQTLASRPFRLGLSATIVLHLWNGLSIYTSGLLPNLPLNYNLIGLFRDVPFSYAENALYSSQIYITVVAVAFFLRLPISFSLWATFALQQLVRIWLGSTTGDPSIRGQEDFSGGAFLGFTLMTLYVGRRHFLAVLVAAFKPSRRDTAPGIQSAAIAARILLLSAAGMVTWLALAGCTVTGALVLTLLMLVLFFGLTRIVAETGILHAQMFIPLSRPFLLSSSIGHTAPLETFYTARTLQCIFYDQRESLPVYSSHALRVADGLTDTPSRGHKVRLIGCMVLALLVAYPLSAYSHLRNEYTFASTLNEQATYPIDSWGARDNWAWQLAPAVTAYSSGISQPPGRSAYWIVGGFLSAISLYLARLYLPVWPFHPIGLVMIGSYSINALWASFFVGWVAKSGVIHLGGYPLYEKAKPFVIGLIIGESLAAVFWLVAALILAGSGLTYHAIPILPR